MGAVALERSLRELWCQFEISEHCLCEMSCHVKYQSDFCVSVTSERSLHELWCQLKYQENISTYYDKLRQCEISDWSVSTMTLVWNNRVVYVWVVTSVTYQSDICVNRNLFNMRAIFVWTVASLIWDGYLCEVWLACFSGTNCVWKIA